MRRLRLIVPLFAGLLFCLGCSGGTDERPPIEITGTVTLDGKPLKDGSIHFTSPKTGETAYANLDGSGMYTISFPKADINSAYEVTIKPPVVEEQDAMALAEKPQKKTETKIPAKYSDRTTSGLTTKIEQEGTTEANFDIKSK